MGNGEEKKFMRKSGFIVLFLCAVLLLASCSAAGGKTSDISGTPSSERTENGSGAEAEGSPDNGSQHSASSDQVDYQNMEKAAGFGDGGSEEPVSSSDKSTAESETEELGLTIGDTPVQVEWENNESVSTLKELVINNPLTIQMSMYGGFEQVGAIGTDLPRDDEEITTEAGDIVLYSGNQISIFYGSNSWAYTRLGKITGKTAQVLTDLLGNGDVTITITDR